MDYTVLKFICIVDAVVWKESHQMLTMKLGQFFKKIFLHFLKFYKLYVPIIKKENLH